MLQFPITVQIRRLESSSPRVLSGLVDLLIDAVDAGASVSFLPPLTPATAEAFWRRALAEAQDNAKSIFLAEDEQGIAGCVQLELSTPQNQPHRAEVSKLLVHRRARRRGVARALMHALEEAALRARRTLLTLDTRRADFAEELYRSMGYTLAGVIPAYAKSGRGTYDDTSIFYKSLLELRDERAGDATPLRALHEAAFGQPDEADIIDNLRNAGAHVLSLVGTIAGEPVAHALFSPVIVDAPSGAVATDSVEERVVGLAPMAVRSDWQRAGVGTRLLQEALVRLRSAGHEAVVVLGHPDYYGRVGFEPAVRFGLRWEHPCPVEAFRAIELRPGALAGGGVVRYRPEIGSGE